jgi:hypothetical protein
MPKYKVGDVVTLIADPFDYDDDPGIDEDMFQYFGKTTTVERVTHSKKGRPWYKLEIDGGEYIWDERWMDMSLET